MLKIGITGGIGSGKTTVCEVWQTLGAYLINADAVAKNLMVSDNSIQHQIIDAFGSQAYHSDGSLNRLYLAKEAFDKNRVEQLNKIVHPGVFRETSRLLKEAEQKGHDVAVYEAAILFQKGQPEMFDYIVLVLADESQRIKRVRTRDMVHETKVRNRIKKQQNFEKFENKADIVIINNGSLETLKQRAEEVYCQILNQE